MFHDSTPEPEATPPDVVKQMKPTGMVDGGTSEMGPLSVVIYGHGAGRGFFARSVSSEIRPRGKSNGLRWGPPVL